LNDPHPHSGTSASVGGTKVLTYYGLSNRSK
jgi:hypothetical protein